MRVNNSLSGEIQLLSGVPQGSILSPTLYILFTADIPSPGPGTLDVLFADDIAQIIIYPGRDREALARRTSRLVERINHYQKLWKIKTNQGKFQLLSVSSTKPKDVYVEGTKVPHKSSIKILGMTFTTYGLSNHIKQRKNLADKQLLKLKRFKNLDYKLKVQLFTTMIRPVIEYPVTPICVASKTNIQKLQKTQNKALRACWPGDVIGKRITNTQTHDRFQLEIINVRLFRLASSTWTKLEVIDNDLTNHSNELNSTNEQDHRWWPRISPYLQRGEPAPLY